VAEVGSPNLHVTGRLVCDLLAICYRFRSPPTAEHVRGGIHRRDAEGAEREMESGGGGRQSNICTSRDVWSAIFLPSAIGSAHRQRLNMSGVGFTAETQRAQRGRWSQVAGGGVPAQATENLLIS
jgi:hypothetical protein